MRVRVIFACIAVAVTVALGIGGWLLFADGGDDAESPQATAEPVAAGTSACPDEAEPYGKAPDGFAYEKADEGARAAAVKALDLDEAGGPAEMRLVRREGLTLGSIIGIPSTNPAAYADSIVARAEAGNAEITSGKGYKIIPLPSGTGVAVGVLGCRTVLITAQDPTAVPYLAGNVLGG